MMITIPDAVLQASRMSESEMCLELAVLLFEKEKVTLGQAGRLAGMGTLQFQQLLASRGIPIHYDIAEFEEDLETLRAMGRL
jgi:predicted HTH domain antitoxin